MLAGLLLLGAGCRRAEGPAARPAAGVERTDATGTAVALPGFPGRVVSLLPSLTVSLQALGARDRLVGATRWCRVEEGPAVVRVGDMLRPDLEKIVSLRPDLVLASMEGSSQAHVEKLRAAGVPVFVLGEAHTFEATCMQLLTLGDLLGISAGARAVVEQARREVAAVSERIAGARKKRVFLQLGDAPLVSVSRGTYLHELLEAAGGENVVAHLKVRYPKVSEETVLIARPEVIVATEMTAHTSRAPEKWKALGSEAAVHVLAADDVCQPTPFQYARALRLLAGCFHPERFSGGGPERGAKKGARGAGRGAGGTGR